MIIENSLVGHYHYMYLLLQCHTNHDNKGRRSNIFSYRYLKFKAYPDYPIHPILIF